MQVVPAILLVAVALAATVLAMRLAARFRVTVFPWEEGVHYQNGVFQRILPPGRYVTGVLGREVRTVITARQVLIIPAQEVLTADGFPVKLGVVVTYRVTDARRALEDTAGQWIELLRAAVQLALRAPVQARSLDAVLADRGALEGEITAPVLRAGAELGLAIEAVALRDLVLPAEVRRMVTEAERARREGLAALERARGEQAALRALANAARLMKGNPELHALRVLQSLQAAPGRAAPTLVLGAGSVLPVVGTGAAPPEPQPEPQD